MSDSIVLHLKTWNVKGATLTSLKTDVVNLIQSIPKHRAAHLTATGHQRSGILAGNGGVYLGDRYEGGDIDRWIVINVNEQRSFFFVCFCTKGS